MKLANLLVSGRPRVGIATEKGYAVLPEGMPESIGQVIAGGEEMLRALRGLKSQWLEEIPTHRAHLAPVLEKGKKLLMIGVNYSDHAKECNERELPDPVVFGKFSNALAAHGDVVCPPKDCQMLDYEAELVVIIGRTCRNVSEEEAKAAIWGYTCGNDFSARDLQFRTSQWCTGKSADGFAPTGPCAVTADELDPLHLAIGCSVNGEVRQSDNTENMIHNPYRIVSYLSSFMTLEAGDAIFTGTPSGVVLGKAEGERVWLKEGDRVAVTVEGIGTLENTVGGTK